MRPRVHTGRRILGSIIERIPSPSSEKPESWHENYGSQTPESGIADPHGCALAGRELLVSRTDIPLRQSALEGSAQARAHQTAVARSLGYDSRTQLHLYALE